MDAAANHMISFNLKSKFKSLAQLLLRNLLISHLAPVSGSLLSQRDTLPHEYRSNHLRNRKFQYFNANPVEIDPYLDQEKRISYLNYYYQNNYHQSIIYYNNLILALVVLFILFSVLVLLEEDESYYNLSAISFILLVTFNLILLIFSHNLAKQFLIDPNYYHSSYSNHRYHSI